jgi:hypothetical protein
MPEKDRHLDGMSQVLAADDPNEPFWLARYQLPVLSTLTEEEAA